MFDTTAIKGISNNMNEKRVHKMINDIMARQFEKPKGILGKIAGCVMFFENRKINRWTLQYVQPSPGERILEIGYGPGFAIREIASANKDITIHGVDVSAKMKEEADKKNHDGIMKGIVLLFNVDIHDFAPGITYNKVFSVNNYPLWKRPHESLVNIRELLNKDGELTITVQPREEGADDETARRLGVKIKEDLLMAGYNDIKVSFKKVRPVLTVCVRGRK
ncbi:class I SAM-dependent methyltransferase [Mesobacillus zeae]|uniref:class I SAM-dependent methyltransferase n=1 Tax=Mesobacillus zeae TaxID=1917180 RepID=UPI002175383B|nr:class I SAM-dependent methyltransferase [Mesobacillus zeae]